MKAQLTDVRGIGPSTARALEALGIRSVADLAKASSGQVAAAPGFGEARAADVIAAAGALLAATGTDTAATNRAASKVPAGETAPTEEAAEAPVTKEKEKKKEKKEKKKAKGKKSDKKKKKGKKKGKKK